MRYGRPSWRAGCSSLPSRAISAASSRSSPPPDRRHGARDRDEIGRGGEQNPPLERPFPKHIVLLERGRSGNARGMYIRHSRRRRRTAPNNSWSRALGLTGSRRRGPSDAAAHLLVALLAGVEIGVERAFRVDDQLAPAGSLTITSGRSRPSSVSTETSVWKSANWERPACSSTFFALLAPTAARLGLWQAR